MQRALADLVALTLRPWNAPTVLTHPLTAPIICMDAALIGPHFQIGLFSPLFGSLVITAPPSITTQQQAELFAADAATRLAVRLGYHSVSLIGDNTGALHALESLRAPLSLHSWVQLLRRIHNRLLWSGLHVHLLWTPTSLQPADPISRLSQLSPISIQTALLSARRTWISLLHTTSVLRLFGHLAL